VGPVDLVALISKQGHNLVEGIEAGLHATLPHAHVLTHLEPIEDPRSQQDQALDR
jgi:hypothetical protein